MSAAPSAFLLGIHARPAEHQEVVAISDHPDTPLRIAVVAPPFYEIPPTGYGGTERVCFTLVEGLVDRGHEVTLIGAGPAHVRARFVATSPVAPGEHVPDPQKIEREHARLSDRVVRDLRPDLVHDHTAAGLRWAAGRQPPTVATVHSALDGPDSDPAPYRSAAGTVALVAISRAQQADAPELPWAGCVPNGIRLQDHPQLRRSADYVLFLGRLSRTKGVDVAIRAAQAAGLRLVVAGEWTSPTERRYVERTLSRMTLAGIDFVGPVDDAGKAELFRRAGCLVLPLRWHEPFGLVAVEAMASGVPVVAIRMGAMTELIAHGRTGLLCDRPGELPAALSAAMTMDGAACRPWVADRFSAEAMVAGYLRVYSKTLARSS